MPSRFAVRPAVRSTPTRHAAGGIVVLLAAALASPAAAVAQTAAPATVGTRDSTTIAAQLDSARAAFVTAANSGNRATMLAAYADSATATSPGAPGPVPAADFVDSWMAQSAKLTTFRPTRLRITGPADATESGTWTTDTAGEGSYTLVWRRRADGRWAVRTLNAS